jgi:Recombinase
MSEADLHVLRARLRGGMLNKASRVELMMRPPVGLVYDANGHLVLDPDKQVQQSVQLLFDTFRRTGSATATVEAFRKQGLLFPRRVPNGPNQGELLWSALTHNQVLRALHNPRYAGAFVFGQNRVRKKLGGGQHHTCAATRVGSIHARRPRRLYLVGRIRKQPEMSTRMRASARAGTAQESAEGGSRSIARTGFVRHLWEPHDGLLPRTRAQTAAELCLSAIRNRTRRAYLSKIPSGGIDQAVGELLIASVTPLALEVALSVQEELQTRVEQADRLRQAQVDRARYEADLARRRYMQVDPLSDGRSYVATVAEMLVWWSSREIPRAHNYKDFRKAIKPLSCRQRLNGLELPFTSQCARAAAFISRSVSVYMLVVSSET